MADCHLSFKGTAQRLDEVESRGFENHAVICSPYFGLQ